jgi:hypothetical protein
LINAVRSAIKRSRPRCKVELRRVFRRPKSHAGSDRRLGDRFDTAVVVLCAFTEAGHVPGGISGFASR